MPKRSAGLLVYRLKDGVASGTPTERRVEVLLVHPGGPYWSRRDDGWWSVPKGEVGDEEDELAAAEREFSEELGLPVPSGPRLPLGDVVQAGGKRVRTWAIAGDLDVTLVHGGTFELEWPPRSGTRHTFPEVDRAAWYGFDDAKVKILPGQLPLLDRLVRLLDTDPEHRGTPEASPR